MFEGIVDARPGAMPLRRWAGVPGAASLHLLFVTTLIALGLLSVDPIDPPDIPLIWQPPPAGGLEGIIIQLGNKNGGDSERRKEEPPKPRPPEPKPVDVMAQPEPEPSTPPVDPVPQSEPSVAAVDTGDSVGEGPKGSPEGSPTGHPDGIPGGSEIGIPGALGHGGPGTGLGSGAGPGGSGDDEPIRVMGDVRAPVKISGDPPIYPDAARRARIQGKVILEAVIDTAGNIVDIRVLKSEPLLTDAAIAAVRQWKYSPALQNGRPVKVYFSVVVEFRLH